MGRKGSNMSLEMHKRNSVVDISLKGADSHNALSKKLVQEITRAFHCVAGDSYIRVVVLGSNGKSFCAGADLKWLIKMSDSSFEENYNDFLQLSRMYKSIYDCSKPTIGKIEGAAIGGGVGVVAACDIAIASEDASFCFSELKLGLVPAVISPYVIEKIGVSNARELFLTGESFDAYEAKQMGLISEVVRRDEVDRVVKRKTECLLTSGPDATKACKKLIRRFSRIINDDDIVHYTVDAIARIGTEKEAQEGMKAFLEKQIPSWTSTND
ncbi:MAG: enoyl-CoA hydratase-related protein [Candidatus Sifarchaeia archaeon]|jgi:methylglutaconyl-CoA hydratase